MRQDIKQQSEEIVRLLDGHPEGLVRGQIEKSLRFSIHYKTLQRRLSDLAEAGKITRSGSRKAARYYSVNVPLQENKGQYKRKDGGIFGKNSKKVLKFLDSPPRARPKVSYKRALVEEYTPNKTAYVPADMRKKLLAEGQLSDEELAAGTYAQHICQRLLIDLSWNSSRLEGNTYSKLDTQKLIEEGISAEGKAPRETVMVSNHKEAISFLVENAQDIEPDIRTISTLHHLLSQDLLANPEACGKIRTIAVNIGRSAYMPIDNRHVLRELLELVLLKARKIENPFEQSFFLLVHLSYLQAFEDVNKRTSRLGCNIPFIKSNLCPLSFTGVLTDDYTAALLAVYEQNELAPMLDLFRWAYIQSCDQYSEVRESLGDIDGFRILYRAQRKEAMGLVIRSGLHGKAAEKCVERFCAERQIPDVEKFTAMAMTDLDTLHVNGIVGLGISESQFNAWLESKPVGLADAK